MQMRKTEKFISDEYKQYVGQVKCTKCGARLIVGVTKGKVRFVGILR